jgi:hypothetical protein
MANQHKASIAELRAIYGEEAAIPEQMDTEVYIRVTSPGMPMRLWHYDKFVGRIYVMREMYQAWSENGKSLAGTEFADEAKDPFYDPPEDQLLGKRNSRQPGL